MKTFTVYTFWVSGRDRQTKSAISTYTTWCPQHWEGYKMYKVEAASGKEAKRIARDKRWESIQAADIRLVEK